MCPDGLRRPSARVGELSPLFRLLPDQAKVFPQPSVGRTAPQRLFPHSQGVAVIPGIVQGDGHQVIERLPPGLRL